MLPCHDLYFEPFDLGSLWSGDFTLTECYIVCHSALENGEKKINRIVWRPVLYSFLCGFQFPQEFVGCDVWFTLDACLDTGL